LLDTSQGPILFIQIAGFIVGGLPAVCKRESKWLKGFATASFGLDPDAMFICLQRLKSWFKKGDKVSGGKNGGWGGLSERYSPRDLHPSESLYNREPILWLLRHY